MPELGRVTIDATGVIVDADRDFHMTVRCEDMIVLGRNLLDFTAPADRERCIFLLDRLVTDGAPVSTVKRLVRADDTHRWVCNHLSLAAPDAQAIRIDIVVEEANPPSDWVDPEHLLRVARLMFEGRRQRIERFPASLFSDHAWDILLTAYIREAEGLTLTTAELQEAVGLSLANASRWMRALSAEGLLEYEENDDTALVTAAFRLSCDAHQKFERYLSDRYRRVTELTLDR